MSGERQGWADRIRSDGDRPRLTRVGLHRASASHGQERLWFLDQLTPGSTRYNIVATATLHGTLERAALQAAFDAVVARHEALRTAVVVSDGSPEQSVVDAAEAPLVLGWSEAIDRADAISQGRALALMSLPLERAPLAAARVFELGPTEHVLAIVVHHIVADGWSMHLLVAELGEAYRAAIEGRLPELPELAVQYLDYTVWRREELDDATLQRDLDHWRSHLRDAATTLNLPFDRTAPRFPTYEADTITFDVASDIVVRLAERARAADATMFMTLHASLVAALHRLTGQDDLLVGAAVANRDDPALERLIGFFADLVVVRSSVTARASLAAVLAQTRRDVLLALAHRRTPFEMVVQTVSPERDAVTNPLVQVALQFDNVPRSPVHFGTNLRLSDLRLGGVGAKFDLSIAVSRSEDGGLAGSITYPVERFERATVQRIADVHVTMLRALADEPAQFVGEVDLCDGRTAPLVRSFASGPVSVSDLSSVSVPGVFGGVVGRWPSGLAVVGGGVRWSFGELDVLSAGVAARLQAVGVGVESFVGVCMERSPLMVAVWLGVLRAGGVYVPLDPSFPRERLAFMAGDAGVSALVAGPGLAGLVGFDGPVLSVGSGADVGGGVPSRVVLGGSSAAYVMYTSGTTGRPKGVVVTHAGIVGLVVGAGYASLGPGEVVAFASNPGFDASTFEVWGGLLTGAAVAVAAPTAAGVVDSAVLAGLGVTVRFVTTALLNASPVDGTVGGVGQLLVGGEVLRPDAARARLAARLDGRFVHAYGPTEATTFATTHVVEGVERGSSVPIGTPVANTSVHVVDGELAAVPPDVVGELVIGGPRLARGYLGRPGLTAERFVPDPFSAGGRVYRSGDRARWRDGGVLEFLGRFDAQVKVRGHRVEPAEVEAALVEHPAVDAAVVVAHPDPSGGNRLVAYFITSAANPPSPSDLATHLRRSLPEAMVPTTYLAIDAVPVTANHKVDRAALPPPPPPQSAAVAPTTATEEQLTTIWSTVLGIDNVGIDDNFFDLGGHSLLATQIISRIRTTLGVEVPLVAVFDYPTVRELAAALPAFKASAPPPITPMDRQSPGRVEP